MTDRPVGLGLIGCGWAASEIVRAAAHLPGLRIVGVFDPDATRATETARTAGARIAADIDALLADPDVEAAYVGIPHALLAPTAERCLLAGKHVLVEKPMALEPEEALRLGRLADERSLRLCVFFELRRSSVAEAARELLAAGAVGLPRLIRVRTLISKPLSYWGPPGAPNWRASRAMAGGGVVLMNTIHQLDMLRYLTGLDFVRASGAVATFAAPSEVEDTASATLTLANGALLSLVAGAHVPGATQGETIEIDGTHGRLDLPAAYADGTIRLFRYAEGAWEDIPVPAQDSHRLMIEDFLGAVRTGSAVPASAADAASALGAVLAIYRSAAEGRSVDIPPLDQVGSSAAKAAR